MRAFRSFRPSPALAVASIALFVALAEVSWATVSVLVPRNSVGTAQLRANAVTSTKIRNGTVLLRDLAPGARVRGPAGPAGPQGPAGPAGAVTSRWAVMNASGSLARSGGTTSAGRLGLGVYEVIFNANVTECAFVASVGETGSGATQTGYAATTRRSGNANGVRVDTRSANGGLADRPFHLVVVC
jgi:hypothetical protein